MIFITELNTDNFESFTESGITLIDVCAEWSQVSKETSPIVDELSNEYYGVISVGRLNFDANKEIVIDMGITDIPAILIYKDGEMVNQSDDFTKEALVDMINDSI